MVADVTSNGGGVTTIPVIRAWPFHMASTVPRRLHTITFLLFGEWNGMRCGVWDMGCERERRGGM